MAGISNKERAKRRLDDIKAEKAEIAKIEKTPDVEANRMTLILSPR